MFVCADQLHASFSRILTYRYIMEILPSPANKIWQTIYKYFNFSAEYPGKNPVTAFLGMIFIFFFFKARETLLII